MATRPFYREIEHTGDLAIEVFAGTCEELLAGALIAMARLMVEEDGIRALEQRRISAGAESDAEAMRDLLAAALNLFIIDSFIWRAAAVSAESGSVAAILTGERFDPARHQLLEEIKAVTWHRLTIERTANEWRATIVFDA